MYYKNQHACRVQPLSAELVDTVDYRPCIAAWH